MALRLDEISVAQRERLEPHIERLRALVRRRDPSATFSLEVSNIPEFWQLNAYVRPDLVDNWDFEKKLAEVETDLLLEHEVAIMVMPVRRADAG